MRVKCKAPMQCRDKFRHLVKAVFILGILFDLSTYSQAAEESFKVEKTYLDWDDIKCDDTSSPNCYSQAYCNIWFKTRTEVDSPDIKTCSDLNREKNEIHTFVNGYSSLRLKREKTDTVIVTIHGLWDSGKQFDATLENITASNWGMSYNAIQLTLPGHIKDRADDKYYEYVKENIPFVTYDKWLAALDSTLKLAKNLGKNTIVIGHSTGGLLAVIAALKYSELISGIVLVEPALQVQPLMTFGACVSGVVPDSVIKNIGKVIGANVREGVSLKMGCEVQKMADKFLKRKFIYQASLAKSGKPYIEDLRAYTYAAKKIKIPVLMLNNENDEVVSATANQYFFLGLAGRKKYIPLNLDGKMPHGEVTEVSSDKIARELFEFAQEELFGNAVVER